MYTTELNNRAFQEKKIKKKLKKNIKCGDELRLVLSEMD